MPRLLASAGGLHLMRKGCSEAEAALFASESAVEVHRVHIVHSKLDADHERSVLANGQLMQLLYEPFMEHFRTLPVSVYRDVLLRPVLIHIKKSNTWKKILDVSKEAVPTTGTHDSKCILGNVEYLQVIEMMDELMSITTN